MEKIILADYDAVNDNYEDILAGKKKGVINLPVPVANILDYAGEKSPWCRISGLSHEELDRVIHYAAWVVTDPGGAPVEKGSVLTENDMSEAQEAYGKDSFAAMTGAEAVYELVRNIDFKRLFEESRVKEREIMAQLEELYDKVESGDEEPVSAEDGREDKQVEDEVERLHAELGELRAYIDSILYIRNHKEGFLIREIRVLPLEIRALANRYADSSPYSVYQDLENLYSAIAGRAHRVKKLGEMEAPDIIMRNEKRMLQEYVDSLIANGMRGKPVTKGDGTPLCCLTDILLCETRLF